MLIVQSDIRSQIKIRNKHENKSLSQISESTILVVAVNKMIIFYYLYICIYDVIFEPNSLSISVFYGKNTC